MIKRFFRDVKKYYYYSVYSAKSTLKSEVADSYLNWIWWILDPLCFMLIYTFIFGYVFKSSEQYFPVYIFVGLTVWTFFNKVIHSSVKMIKSNKAIVSKIYFPKFILLLSNMWVNGFKMLISFGIVVLMMIAYQIPISWNILYTLPILLTFFIATFGIGCFFMHYGVYINDLANVVVIALRMLFYVTGIFYNLESRIPKYGSLLNRYNPIAFFITGIRNCLIYSTAPDCKMLLIWLGLSVLIAIAGIYKIYKEENSYVKVI